MAFLLEAMLAESTGYTGSTADQLRGRVRNAIASGASVVIAADSPAGSAPQRSRFRLEPIEAAIDLGSRIVPVYAANGDSTKGTVVRLGEPLSMNGSSCTATRQALRDAIERLMYDDEPGAPGDEKHA